MYDIITKHLCSLMCLSEITAHILKDVIQQLSMELGGTPNRLYVHQEWFITKRFSIKLYFNHIA